MMSVGVVRRVRFKCALVKQVDRSSIPWYYCDILEEVDERKRTRLCKQQYWALLCFCIRKWYEAEK
jgi:hypothetical protein